MRNIWSVSFPGFEAFLNLQKFSSRVNNLHDYVPGKLLLPKYEITLDKIKTNWSLEN